MLMFMKLNNIYMYMLYEIMFCNKCSRIGCIQVEIISIEQIGPDHLDKKMEITSSNHSTEHKKYYQNEISYSRMFYCPCFHIMNTFKNVLKLDYTKNLEAQFMMAGFVGCWLSFYIKVSDTLYRKTEHFLTQSNEVHCVFLNFLRQ